MVFLLCASETGFPFFSLRFEKIAELDRFFFLLALAPFQKHRGVGGGNPVRAALFCKKTSGLSSQPNPKRNVWSRRIIDDSIL